MGKKKDTPPDTPAGESSGADLAAIEAQASMANVPPDPAGAVQALAELSASPEGGEGNDASSTSSQGGGEDASTTPAKPKNLGGRPKGAKNKPKGRAPGGGEERPAAPGGLRGRVAELEAEKAALEARLALLGPDGQQQIKESKEAISIAVMMSGAWLVKNAGPAWAFDKSECDQLGDIWAPILAPHREAMGPAAPYLFAGLLTLSVLYPKWQKHRELAAGAEVLPGAPLAPGVTVERNPNAPDGGVLDARD